MEVFIEKGIKRTMQKELACMMFDILSSKIGETVVCKTWNYGEAIDIEGVLEEVVPFDYVTINKNIVPFVGEGRAIEEIAINEDKVLTGPRRRVLYTNPMAIGYKMKDPAFIADAQRKMFGYSVKEEELAQVEAERAARRSR